MTAYYHGVGLPCLEAIIQDQGVLSTHFCVSVRTALTVVVKLLYYYKNLLP
jgi:hypothetical protein